MKSKRDLSAKDKAFMKEKIKLHSIIHQKDDEIDKLKKVIAEMNAEATNYKMKVESLEKTVKLLETKIGIPTDKLINDIERREKLFSMISPALSVFKEYI